MKWGSCSRGPWWSCGVRSPWGELNARQVRIDIKAASPFTSETVLAAINGIELDPAGVGNAGVLVQRYGAPNDVLRRALEARGAAVDEIATYRWALPNNLQPLVDLLDALAQSRVDAVVFTSAVQIHNLYAVAATLGRAASLADHLKHLVIASIGPRLYARPHGAWHHAHLRSRPSQVGAAGCRIGRRLVSLRPTVTRRAHRRCSRRLSLITWRAPRITTV